MPPLANSATAARILLPQESNSFSSNSKANDKQSQTEAQRQDHVSLSLWGHCFSEREWTCQSRVSYCIPAPLLTLPPWVTL